SNADEVNSTGPNDPQTDPLDGCSFNLLEQSSYPAAWSALDCDGDGVSNGEEVDPDGDGLAGPNGTDPNDPCSMNFADVNMVATSTGDCDGDGVSNADEVNSTGPNDPATDPTDGCVFNAAEVTLPNTADNQAPEFANCPTDIQVINDVDKCGALVNWTPITATDECGFTMVQTGGLPSGSLFPVGTTTQVYQATDVHGNTSTCSFTIVVMDMQLPAFDADVVMPANLTVECDAIPTAFVLTNEDVNDNCTPAAQLTIQYQEVSTQSTDVLVCGYYNYVLTRTWTVTDASGNSRSHVQKITVQDTESPVANCGAVTLVLDALGNAVVASTAANNGSTDNCAPAQALSFSLGQTAFSCDNLGTQLVMLVVSDPCGNTASCATSVTVEAGTIPCTVGYSAATNCLNNATSADNGQFEEVITIQSLAAEVWTLSTNTGLYSVNSQNPPATPVSLATGTLFTPGVLDGIDNDGDNLTDEADEVTYYTLKGRFTECVGYTVNVTNANTPGMAVPKTATLSNKACYPQPAFTNLNDPFCVNTPVFTIGVADANGAQGTLSNVMVNGTPSTQFDASALGLGFHTVMATFNAGAAGTSFYVNGALQAGSIANPQLDPGCQQTITRVVQVVSTPTVVSCNNHVQVALDADCEEQINPDAVLTGTFYCMDDYSLVLDKVQPMGNGPWVPAVVNSSDIGKTYQYQLVHAVSGNTCSGTLEVIDNLAPVLVCPAAVTVSCSESTAVSHTGNVLASDCGTVSIQVDDVTEDFGLCQQPKAKITRTFIVTDASGNQSTCQQSITIEQFNLSSVVFPANVTLNCETYQSDAVTPDQTGAPSINGFPVGTVGGSCSASVNYSDEVFQICANSFEIVRTWKVRNICQPIGAGNPIEHTQLIQVLDLGGPQLVCPSDLTISTDANNNCATTALPSIVVSEGCSGIVSLVAKVTGVDPSNGNIVSYTVNGSLSDFAGNNYGHPDTMANFGLTQCLPMNYIYQVQYTAKDGCGNVSSCEFALTIEDQVPPIASCDEWIQVALGLDGTALVPAISFDNGSADNLGAVFFKARRMNNNDCQPHTLFQDEVRFCCSDVNDTIAVVLRVYDAAQVAGAISADGHVGNYNDCMV
ncbi:MAG: HYR domain-containing protein, partial [Chitinophagales bacterium]